MRVTLDRRETPFAVLERAATSGASGELVSATDVAEVHVYVLEGRVAWATSSSTRSAFTQHLVESCGLDREALREAIAESQRTRTRLGETLVSWGLVSQADLRAALHVQVNRTLEELSAMDHCQALFLPRHMEYDSALTFSLDEVRPRPSRTVVAQREAVFVSVTELVQVFPDARWASVLCEGEVCSSTAKLEAAHALVRTLDTLLCQRELRGVVLRSAFGSVLGARDLTRGCSMWVALPAEAKLGVAVTLLNVASQNQPPRHVTYSSSLELKVHGRFIEQVPLTPLRQAMMGSDQMVAAFVTSATGEESGIARVGLHPQPITELAREGVTVLASSYHEVFEPSRTGTSLTYEHLALCMDVGPFMLFQTRLPQKPDLTLSLAFECGTTPGLAWALLGTLSRQLND